MRRLVASLVTFLLTTPLVVFAEKNQAAEPQAKPATGLGEAATVAGNVAGGAGFAADPPSPAAIAGTIVQALLGLIGVLFLVLIIVGGFKWMTAGGNEEQVKKAKTLITNATIGLVIVLGAWMIYVFVIQSVLGLTPLE